MEQDPTDWMRIVSTALHRFSKATEASEVAGIGITSQANTHVFTDGSGTPLTVAIVWQDSRATDQAARLDQTVNQQERIDWWGAPMGIDTSHAMARLSWMQESHPDIWSATRHVLLPKDWCIQQLTGEIVSDPLSNIGLVGRDGRYVSALLDRVEGAANLFPALFDPISSAGVVQEGQAFAGVPVAVGTIDAWAGVFGTGSTQEGTGLYLSGTSEILGVLSHTVVPTPGVLVMPEIHNMRLYVGPTQSGGASQLWFCKLFGITPDIISQEAATHKVTGATPLFLPHLQGERAPLWDPSSRGSFLGLNASSDRAALAFAVYEGVACSARLLLDSLESSAGVRLNTLNAGGGGFRSDV